MMLKYVQDNIQIWRIWDPNFGKAVNCSDLYFNEGHTAYMSCMADSDRTGDPLGLPEEKPVVTEVIEEAPAQDPQSEPDRVITAIPSQPRMLTRIQLRQAARANTALATEVTTDDNPRSYREAMSGPLQHQWKVAMQQEYTSLLENHTFTPVKYARSKPFGCEWVYKT